MKKSDWQYLVDTLLFFCIVSIVFIGFLLGLVLPKGPDAPESSKYFLGLHRHDWGDIHFYLSIVFTSLVIIHLILSWSWIKGKAKQIFKKNWNTALILTTLLAITVFVLLWGFWPKSSERYVEYGIETQGRIKHERLQEQASFGREELIQDEAGDSITITGQMTLRDVENATGVPAKKIGQGIGLPSGVSLDETLGRLRKRYFFTMQDVRDAVASLMKK